MLNHESLENYYKTTFALIQHHKYRLEDLENMIPWERYIYLDMLANHIKEQEEKK